jgi:hypothetical protein
MLKSVGLKQGRFVFRATPDKTILFSDWALNPERAFFWGTENKIHSVFYFLLRVPFLCNLHTLQ